MILTTRNQAINTIRESIGDMKRFPRDSAEFADAQNIYQVAFNALIHLGMTPTQIFREAQIDLAQFKGERS